MKNSTDRLILEIVLKGLSLFFLVGFLVTGLWSQNQAENKTLTLPLGPKQRRGRSIRLQGGQR